jgi:hypothetical protein
MLDIHIGCSHRNVPGVPGLLRDRIRLTGVANAWRHIVLYKLDTVAPIVQAHDIQISSWVWIVQRSRRCIEWHW